MRILVDENVSSAVVNGLREAGHDVESVRESARGANDESVAAQSAADRRILLTYDKDFGELLYATPPKEFVLGSKPVGIVLLRLDGMPYPQRLRRVMDLFANDEIVLHGNFTVVEPARTRQRALPGATPQS